MAQWLGQDKTDQSSGWVIYLLFVVLIVII